MAARFADCQDYTTFTSAVSLLDTNGRPAERLEVIAASGTSTVTVKTQGGGATARVLGVVTGSVIEVGLLSLDAVANVTRVRAYWPLTV